MTFYTAVVPCFKSYIFHLTLVTYPDMQFLCTNIHHMRKSILYTPGGITGVRATQGVWVSIDGLALLHSNEAESHSLLT